jgi:hypothetical protein
MESVSMDLHLLATQYGPVNVQNALNLIRVNSDRHNMQFVQEILNAMKAGNGLSDTQQLKAQYGIDNFNEAVLTAQERGVTRVDYVEGILKRMARDKAFEKETAEISPVKNKAKDIPKWYTPEHDIEESFLLKPGPELISLIQQMGYRLDAEGEPDYLTPINEQEAMSTLTWRRHVWFWQQPKDKQIAFVESNYDWALVGTAPLGTKDTPCDVVGS